MSLRTAIDEAVYELERETAVLVALLSAQYPTLWYDRTDDERVYMVQLPQGLVQYPLGPDHWGLFGHLMSVYCWTADRHPEQSPDHRRTVLRQLTVQLASERVETDCTETLVDQDGNDVLSCVLKKHGSGNHKTPDGRSWWVDR